jgi:hypothetical protein
MAETGLTLLAHAYVHFWFWSDAFTTTCFLINRLPTHVLNMKTPLEFLFQEVPDYTFLKVFGCACWPHTRPYNSRKLEFAPKSAFSLVIALFTKGTSVFIFPLIKFISLVMWFLMKTCFPLQIHHHICHLRRHKHRHPHFRLINLLMLHIRLYF